MENCDKFKKKFYLGSLVIFLMASLPIINKEVVELGTATGIILAILLFIVGLYLASPYVKCFSDNKYKRPRF